MSFWEVHGFFGGLAFIIFLLLVPRLTLLFTVSLSSIIAMLVLQTIGMSGGYSGLLLFLLTIAAWVGCIIWPRVGIAVIATMLYWNTNVVLLVVAWCIA